jgi:hypothetical protein
MSKKEQPKTKATSWQDEILNNDEQQSGFFKEIENRRVDPIFETLISVSMLSELLIDEMCKLKGTGLYRDDVRTHGKQFHYSLMSATIAYIQQYGPDVAKYFEELGREMADVFDVIIQMS